MCKLHESHKKSHKTEQSSFNPPEAEDASPQLYRDVTPSMVRRTVTGNFTDIDTNKNNSLSQRELSAYKPNASDQLIHDYSKKHFHELTRVHNGSLFGDNQISRTDLIQFEIQQDPNLPAVQQRYNKYADLLEDNFEIIDADKNKKLTVGELDAALGNPQLDVGAKQTVRFFRDNYDAVTGAFKPAFFGSMDLERDNLNMTRGLFDFKSSLSKANGFEYFATGALMGSVAGGLMTAAKLWKALGYFPGWQSVAIGAAVGGLAFGGYMYITGQDAIKNIPISREKLWHSINAELAQEAAGQAPQMVREQPTILEEPSLPTAEQPMATDQNPTVTEEQPPRPVFESPQYMRNLRKEW